MVNSRLEIICNPNDGSKHCMLRSWYFVSTPQIHVGMLKAVSNYVLSCGTVSLGVGKKHIVTSTGFIQHLKKIGLMFLPFI
jgi:hypothetical protein